MPEYLPAFPDSHAYVQTPTHKQPITNYEAVREKAASQKRDMERALTRFIAKTGPVDRLFDTDEQAQFPREWPELLADWPTWCGGSSLREL